MTSTRKAGIGGIIACLLGAVLFGFIGMSDQKFVNNCQTTPGQITEVVKRTKIERNTSSNSNSYRTKRRITYDVTFAYTVNGNGYTQHSNLGHAVDVGPATVYYLPSDPEDAKLEKPSPMLDFLVAAALLVGAVVVAYKTLIGGGAETVG